MNSATTGPIKKNRPIIVAAGPKPPRLTISVPAIKGPIHEMKRGPLKQNAIAVPRIRVGNNSGSQIGAQAQMPIEKKPKTATQTSRTMRFGAQS